MLDLRTEAVKAWLNAFDPNLLPALPAPFTAFETKPDLDDELAQMTAVINFATHRAPQFFARPQFTYYMRQISAHFGEARLIRLTAWLTDPNHPSRHQVFAALCTPQKGEHETPFQAILRLLASLALVQQMTAAGRIATLHAHMTSLPS